VADEQATYQALYRRFRPQRFADVVGQDHVTRPLRAAVSEGKVAHAYLFSGPRGTGKTSTARILAMALNCERPAAGEPCGECQSCLAIRQGASLDVQELDSATNRGIDEMRDLLSRVALGTPGRWKVYIVDEVHQMTSAAASALLKTLEEPPAHVVFVLATTDPQKVMETIRSRTQHFEFRLISSEVLASLVADVVKEAQLDVPPEAVDVVVRRGHGSARDALSALDQVAAAGTVDDDTSVVPALVDSLIDRDATGVLVKVAEASRAGLDPRRLGSDLLEHLRNGFLSTRAPELVLLTERAAAEAETQARKLGAAALVRAMEVVGQALIDMRDSADPRTTLEVALVRLAAPELDDGHAALLQRIERLEQALAGRATAGEPPAPLTSAGAASPAAEPGLLGPPPATPGAGIPGAGTPDAGIPGAGTPGAGTPARRAAPVAGLPTREELTIAWGDSILPSLRPAVKVYVATGRFLASEGSTAVFALPDRGLLGRAAAGREEVESALSAHFGRPVPLKLVLDDGTPTSPSSPPAPAAPEDAPPADWQPPAPAEWEEMDEAAAADVSPERRLLEAFPGAEEVT
jgi:DNA polymerase-3 subunit gamma/tau